MTLYTCTIGFLVDANNEEQLRKFFDFLYDEDLGRVLDSDSINDMADGFVEVSKVEE